MKGILNVNGIDQALFKEYSELPQNSEELIDMIFQNRPHVEFSDSQLDTIWQAYLFSLKSGENVQKIISKLKTAISVLKILTEYSLDTDSICTVLLHPFVKEDLEEQKNIKRHFGSNVSSLLQGIIQFNQLVQRQSNSEELKNLLLNIISDIRITLISLAMRLCLIEETKSIPSENLKITIAKETINIYALLAERLGMWKIKSKLEDYSFRILNQSDYYRIEKEIEHIQSKHKKILNDAIECIRTRATESDLDVDKFTFTGRPKHIYSIFKKENTPKYKEHGVDRIYDKLGIRIIVKEIHECYLMRDLIHAEWKLIPDEFDDYIKNPRKSGYQSLHTAIRYGDGKHEIIEFQIRTYDMHNDAEYGIAAHWIYKEGLNRSRGLNQRIATLRQIVERLQNGEDPESLKEELGSRKIIVYTHKGDPISILEGSTPIDFAYKIHSEVGNQCDHAIVNGKPVALNYILKPEDHIEIVTSQREPNRAWLDPKSGYAKNPQTRNKIRRWFRKQNKEQYILDGRKRLIKELRRLGLVGAYTNEEIAQVLKFDKEEEFFAKFGYGDIQSSQIRDAISILQRKHPIDELHNLIKPKKKKRPVQSINGLRTKIAGCCNPLPPQSIIGFITRGNGLTIHAQSCKQLAKIKEQERLIDIDWDVQESTFSASISISAFYRSKVIADMANILKAKKLNLLEANTTINNDIVDISIIVEIINNHQLNSLLTKFENLPYVFEVYRQ